MIKDNFESTHISQMLLKHGLKPLCVFKRLKVIMADYKVLVSSPDVPKPGIDLLKKRFNVIVNEAHTRESLLEKIRGVDAVLWATHVKVDKEMLDAAGHRLAIVASMSAGLDHVDINEMKRRKIRLSNTPNVLNSAVADMAVLLALAASRRLHEVRRHIERGTWTRGNQWMLGQDIRGSAVGIVGLGGIGQEILKKLSVFNVGTFLYCGHREKEEGIELGAQFVPFDTLLENSDFVIVACPLTPETQDMFNERAFAKMKKTAVFVNVSRGGVVDQPALVAALKKGAIFAAGLDVMTPEPLPSDHELLQLPNCVLVPHLGSATTKTRNDMAELAANNIINALAGRPLLSEV